MAPTAVPPEAILQEWQYLASRSSKSPELQKISWLIDVERNGRIALGFRGGDAATVINTIDKLLRENQLPPTTKLRAFKLIRKLAGASRQVPKSYLVSTFTRYKVEKGIIASGAFADIRKGRLNGMDVAVKTLRTSPMDNTDILHEAFCKECVVWMNMSHPNILRLIAVKIKPDVGKFSMISEMITNGNVVNYIKSTKANRIRLLEDVARGLGYLHESEIIHGDLNGKNILINNETPPRACIADFALCIVAPSRSFDRSREEAGGTFGYMAPELFSEGSNASKEADMYAFGMVVYEVITGAHPFGNRRPVELPFLTVNGVRPSRPEDPTAVGFSQGTWEFAERCWDGNPARRPSSREALKLFERVAMVSADVDPGLTIKVHETPYPESEKSSIDLSLLVSGRETSQDSLFVPSRITTDSANQLETWEEDLIAFMRGCKGTTDDTPEKEKAQEFADKLDETLGRGDLHQKKRKHFLRCLRKLCSVFGFLPSSFSIAPTPEECATTPSARGGFSDVHKATLEGRHVAVKKLRATDAGNTERMYRLLVEEVVGWKWLQHENILPFIGVVSEPPHFSIISEWMENGDIMHFSKTHPHHNRLRLLIDTVNGLEYLHKNDIVHGDLKGRNILIDSNCHARLADFGLAVVADESAAGSMINNNGMRGTIRWMAPEMMHPAGFGFTKECRIRLPSKGTDIYSLGMTILEVITGCHPFSEITAAAEVVPKVLTGVRPNRPHAVFTDPLCFTTWLVGLGSQPPKRPQTSTILDLLSKEVENWGKTIVPPPVVESTVRVASRVEDDSGFFRLNQFCGTN